MILKINSLDEIDEPEENCDKTTIFEARAILELLFPGLMFETAGGAMPFQASGTYLEAADFYFRFRGDAAKLVIGRPSFYIPENDYVISKYPVMNEDYAGFLEPEEFITLFSELMNAMFVEHGLPSHV